MEVDAEHRYVVTLPFVVALCGLPGAGKSTLAARLARSTGALHLDRDCLRGEIHVQGGYSAAEKALLNDEMRVRLARHLAAGRSVVLDGMTLARETDRVRFRTVAQREGARWLLAWLDCPLEQARERVAADVHHPAGDRSPALVDVVAARFELPSEGMRLDARRSPGELEAEVLRSLHAQIPGNPF